MLHQTRPKASTFRSPCVLLFFVVAILSQSCSYSVIVHGQRGVAEPDPNNQELGFFFGKQVTPIEQVVKMKLENNQVYVTPPCETPGLYAVEYRVTYGDLLRNALTFGKRRKVRIRYICLKDTNG